MSEESTSVETKRTYCRVCMVHCGLVAEVQGDRILKVRGDFDHPLTKGYTCPKGRATGQIHHLPDAVTRPMMRKKGEMVEVSWDEALDDVAGKLRAVIDANGPHAVGMYFGSGLGLDSSGFYMEERFHEALGGPPKFSPLTNDGTAKLMLAGAMGGFAAMTPRTDYENVDMLVYVGTNPMVSHAHNTGMYNPAGWIRAVAGRGEVWTIDPVRTETAGWSTRHIAPYPGKDYAILAWLTREVIEGGLVAPAQPVQGLDELRALLAGLTRAKAAEIAGVSEQDLEDLLATVKRRGMVVVETGTGVTMSREANLTQWFAWALMALTGAMNRKGGAWFHSGFLFPFESFEPPIVDSTLGPGPKTRPDVKGILGEWPCAVLPDEIKAGNIRAFMNFGGSIIRSFPDANALSEALDMLELNVAFEIVHNDTTEHSTHILPTKDAVERAEFTRWDTLGWNAALQYTPALVPPMGERRSAWWVIAEIMRRADLPVPEHVPASDLDPGADDFMLSTFFQTARCSWAELKDKRYVEAPVDFPAAWVDDHIERMGGWRLAHPDLVGQWNEIHAEDEAALGQPRPLIYTPRRQRRKLNGQLSFLGEAAEMLIHPLDAAANGIEDGQKVCVRNESGEIVLTAKVDETMRRGVVSIPHGHETANVNRLTSTSAIDRLGGMAHYSGVPVSLEPAA